jgi:hypothetical protein
MSDLPPDDEEAAEVDGLYRRMSAAEPTQPGQGVRVAVLAYATQRAAQAAAEAGVVPKEYSWQRRRRAWGRPLAFGALAAGILAAFMLGPRFPGPPPLTVPAITEERAAAAPPPVYADLTSSSLAQERPPPPMTAFPDAKPGRVPRDALQRQPVAPAAADTRTANVPTAAPAAQDASARAEASGRLDAERARGAAASAEMATAPVATSTTAAGLAKGGRPEDAAALWRAAENGDLARLRALHEQHADLNATDSAGRTALMLATLSGRAQAVAALLDYGADPNIVDAGGRSPLDAARAAHQDDIVSALRARGAR